MTIEPAPEVDVKTHAGSRPNVIVIKVVGPLTIRNFFEFQEATRSQIAPITVIDLAEVPFMDSAALGSILGLHVSCERTKRKYGLVNVNDRLKTMFTVCGVQDVLATFPTVEEAEAALGS